MIAQTKICTKCGETKNATEFFKAKGKPFGITSHCKACKKEWYLRDYEEHPEKYKKREASWRERNPDVVTRIRRNYEKSPARREYLKKADIKARAKERQKSFHNRNPEAKSIYSKVYRQRHQDGRFAEYKKRYKKNLGVGYINELITQRLGISANIITMEITEVKRKQLQIYRFINQKKEM